MAEETIYNSIHTGEQIDSAVAWLLKHAQDHICGGAAPGTTIETPSDPTYWFAGAGTYTCGSSTISIPDGRIGIISYDGSDWSSETFDVGKSIVYLDSMGEELDGVPVYITTGMVIYDPDISTIKRCTAPNTYENIGCNENVLYCNKVTNILYRWSLGSLDMIQVGAAKIKVINNLDVGGKEDPLSAEMGKRLREKINDVQANIERLYNNLGNIAFWNAATKAAAAPIPIDWGGTKRQITLSLNLNHAVVKHNGVAKSNGDTIQVEENTTLTLTVIPDEGYELSAVYSLTGTVSQDKTTVTLAVGQSNVTLDITAIAVATYSISYGTMTNCSVAQGSPTSISSSVQIQFSVDSGYELLASNITVTNADKSFNSATNVLTISNPTGTVSISATASVPTLKFLKGRFLNASGIHDDAFYQAGDQSSHPENYCEVCVVSDYIQVPAPSSASTEQPLFSVCWARTLGSSTQAPSQWQLYRKETNGTYTYLDRRAWDANGQTKNDRGGTNPDIIDAWNAGTLFVRTTLTLTSASANTIHKNCYLKQGSIVLFNSSTPYTLVLPEDWTIDDLTNGNE